MEDYCGALPGEPADGSCMCRPLTPFEGIALEHYTLGVVQLLKAGYVFVWLRLQRRAAAAGGGARRPEIAPSPLPFSRNSEPRSTRARA
jgi:hypothetical protein